MTTDTDKLYRLADELAHRHGFECVVHQFHTEAAGPASRLTFESTNSFESVASIVTYHWRESAAEAYKRCCDAMEKWVDSIVSS